MLQLAHAGNGVLRVRCAAPTPCEAEVAQYAGADLVRNAREAAAWLRTLKGPRMIGAYA